MNLEDRARAHAALGEPARLAIVDHLVLGDAAPGELSTCFGMATNLLAFHLRVLENAGLVRRVRSEGDRRRQYVQLRLDDPVVATLTRPAPGPVTSPAASSRVGATPDAVTAGSVPQRVVFVCTANSARSQLAAAAWRRVSSLPVTSAGTHPAPRVHPRAIAAGRRHGLDLTGAAPAALTTAGGSYGTTGAPVGEPDGEPYGGAEEPLLVAVCDNAHEELSRGLRSQNVPGAAGPRSPHSPHSPHSPAGPGDRGGAGRQWLHWHIPDPVRVDTDEAFEAAYTQIAERVGRLAAALTPDPSGRGDLPAAS